MKRQLVFVLLFNMLIIMSIPGMSFACSTFCFMHEDQPIFGRNYDWMAEDGLVMVNKRNMVKTAATNDARPAHWVSKYGSVTFNQYGRDLPTGGMNEAGLVVEQMWLDETVYPTPDERPAVDELQWIQYHLDQFSTLEEVIAAQDNVRVSNTSAATIHYLVCDRSGACGTFEYLDGTMVIHTADTLPVNVLTNDIYTDSVEFLNQHEGFGGDQPLPDNTRSLARFARAAQMMQKGSVETLQEAIHYGFEILAQVAQSDYTMWRIVYDAVGGKIYFRTLSNPNIRSIDVSAFDFSCTKPVLVLDMMETTLSGEVNSHFTEYTTKLNRDLIGRTFSKVEFLQGVPPEALDALAHYPESSVCQE